MGWVYSVRLIEMQRTHHLQIFWTGNLRFSTSLCSFTPRVFHEIPYNEYRFLLNPIKSLLYHHFSWLWGNPHEPTDIGSFDGCQVCFSAASQAFPLTPRLASRDLSMGSDQIIYQYVYIYTSIGDKYGV